MANEMNTLAASTSFLKRPEGKFGAVFTAICFIAVLVLFGSQIGDFLVNAVDNVVHVVIVVSLFAALAFMLLDKNTRHLAFYIYRALMRLLASFVIDIDPIGVLKTYKEKMFEKLTEMKTAIDQLRAQRIKVERLKVEKTKKFEEQMSMLHQAKLAGDPQQITLYGREVERLNAKISRYVGDLTTMHTLITVMSRYYGICDTTIKDMDNEIVSRQEDDAYASSSKKAVRAALSIMKGLPEKDMWDESITVLENRYTAAMGEVEGFLDVTKGILSDADLSDSASAERALARLSEWEAKNANLTFGNVTKATIIQEAKLLSAGPTQANFPASTSWSNTVATQNSGESDDYSSFLK